MLERTPFYVEAGGQVSDTGALLGASGDVDRRSSMSSASAPACRAGTASRSAAEPLRVGDAVTPVVDHERRAAVRRNHTGTHLLHAALRQTLGAHVKQAGSLVAPDRLRFDFVHSAAVTRGRPAAHRADRQPRASWPTTPVRTEVKDTQQAIADGATALFGEKYGDQVRVVAVGDGRFSTELCGGTHVRATGDIGLLVLTEESGVAAGVRRIEALTGPAALAHLRGARRRPAARLRGRQRAVGAAAGGPDRSRPPPSSPRRTRRSAS